MKGVDFVNSLIVLTLFKLKGCFLCKLCTVIGTNGNNIKKAKALPGVHHIDVRNDDTIIIFADQQEQAEAARDLLEVVTEQVCLKWDQNWCFCSFYLDFSD